MLKPIWNRRREIISMLIFLVGPKTENYGITHERKLWTHKMPMRKYFGHTKHPRDKILDPRNTHEKKIWTHEIHTRKNLDPQNTHEKKFWTHEIPTKARCYGGSRPTSPTMARDPRNSAHSFKMWSNHFM